MQPSELNSFLPQTKLDAVLRGLQSAFGTTTVDAITPLGGGLSSAFVYKIVVHNKPYALRIIMDVNALADPARQYICTKIAADACVSPKLHYSNIEDAVAITDFVEAIPLLDRYPNRDELLPALANTIRRLHDAPLFPKLVNFMDAIDGFIAEYQAAPIFPASATDELFERYAEVQACYPRYDPDLVSSHNDLNYRNIVCDSRQIWLVDWEAAFQNDRFADLATLGNSFVNNEAQEELFLRTYFGDSLDDVKRARYFLARQIRHLFYALVMIRVATALAPADWHYAHPTEVPSITEFRRQIGSGEIDLATIEGQLLFARVEMNEALHEMRSERFAAAVETIKALA
jgi:thiamine kinase-like enzyme